ncbi:TAXI family TRAP transporter solute-binding subunit [Polynucleobacter necessarius]|uniref:TAXI family TRAP transporter solute-binding subunit n=1 Tax=Polynucleobacter necessarius TaxID=576610 RepID=UPI000E092946|nr:TAXI family TRAP transporter solute-binding subunit [Polynucleobacter necessarius]
MDHEPVWIFYRKDVFNERAHITDRDIAKLKINIGPVGSGTRTQALNIFKLNNLNTHSPNLLRLGNADGVQALESGQIDGVVLVDGFDSPNVQKLITNPAIRLSTFQRADDYTRLLPCLEEVSVPMGGFELGNNIRDHTIQLIPTTTNLLIDDRLHPSYPGAFFRGRP